MDFKVIRFDLSAAVHGKTTITLQAPASDGERLHRFVESTFKVRGLALRGKPFMNATAANVT